MSKSYQITDPTADRALDRLFTKTAEFKAAVEAALAALAAPIAIATQAKTTPKPKTRKRAVPGAPMKATRPDASAAPAALASAAPAAPASAAQVTPIQPVRKASPDAPVKAVHFAGSTKRKASGGGGVARRCRVEDSESESDHTADDSEDEYDSESDDE